MCPAAQTSLLRKPTRRGSSGGIFGSSGPDNVEERRVLEETLSKVRVRATVGARGAACEKYCERAVKRLEKAQEVVTEALKAQTLGF